MSNPKTDQFKIRLGFDCSDFFSGRGSHGFGRYDFSGKPEQLFTVPPALASFGYGSFKIVYASPGGNREYWFRIENNSIQPLFESALTFRGTSTITPAAITALENAADVQAEAKNLLRLGEIQYLPNGFWEGVQWFFFKLVLGMAV
ncbi:MAG: hypothetical protein V1777_05565 [Candidatus Micrarchaeota archaeon]